MKKKQVRKRKPRKFKMRMPHAMAITVNMPRAQMKYLEEVAAMTELPVGEVLTVIVGMKIVSDKFKAAARSNL